MQQHKAMQRLLLGWTCLLLPLGAGAAEPCTQALAQGRAQHAEQLARAALGQPESPPQNTRQAAALLCLGRALQAQQQGPDAATAFEDALYAATAAGNIPQQLEAIELLGAYYQANERPKRALSYYRLGLQTEPSEEGKARLLVKIATVHVRHREFELAPPFLHEAIRIQRRVQGSAGTANTQAEQAAELAQSLIVLGRVQLERLDFFNAQEALNEALQLSKALKKSSLEQEAIEGTIRLRQKQGNLTALQASLQALIQLQSSLGDTKAVAASRTRLLNTNALSLCELNWADKNHGAAFKAASLARPEELSGELRLCKIKSLYKLERHPEVLDELKQWPERDPQRYSPATLLLAARSHLALKHYREAHQLSWQGLSHPNLNQPQPQMEGLTSSLKFAFLENLILIELTPDQVDINRLNALCSEAYALPNAPPSSIWSECAPAQARAGQFEPALTQLQWAEQWLSEHGTPKQVVENRLVKALMEVELQKLEDGQSTLAQARSLMNENAAQFSERELHGFERQSSEIQALVATYKGERELALNLYVQAIKSANEEGNDTELARLAGQALKLEQENRAQAASSSSGSSGASSRSTPPGKAGEAAETSSVARLLESLVSNVQGGVNNAIERLLKLRPQDLLPRF